MNEGFGIKKFAPLIYLDQYSDCFIKNDTMLIEVKLDFLNEYSTIPSSIYETPNDESRIATPDEGTYMEVDRRILFPS